MLSVAAESAYRSSSYCWSKFTTDRLIEATEIYSDIPPSLNLKAGESMQLSVSLLPANVSLPHIFWVSSDPTVATVDHTGKVTMAGGTSVSRATYDADNKCTITAHTLYAGGPTYSFAINDESTGLELMPDDGSALNGDAEGDAQVEIYNLNGVRMRSSRADLQPGVYIIVTSGKAERVMVK